VHELEGDELPDKSMPQPIRAQGKVFVNHIPRVTRYNTVNNKANEIHNQKNNGHRPSRLAEISPHVRTIIQHCAKNLIVSAKFFNQLLFSITRQERD
jgi:hypothetical protein